MDLYRCVSDKEVYISSLGKLLIEHLPVGEEIPFFNSGINEVDNADPDSDAWTLSAATSNPCCAEPFGAVRLADRPS